MKAREVADLLDVSVRKVYELADSGDLVSYRYGSAVRFELADVEEYKSRCRSHGTKRESVGNTSFAELSAPGVESALIERFRAGGVEPRLKRMTTAKRPDCSPSPPGSVNVIPLRSPSRSTST